MLEALHKQAFCKV